MPSRQPISKGRSKFAGTVQRAASRRCERSRNQPPGSCGPTADDILNRYIQALGGAGRLATLTSFVGKGSYEGFDSYHGKVALEVYAKATGQRTVIAYTQNGDSVTTYDGRNAWIVGPDKPVSVLQLAQEGIWTESNWI